MRHFPVTSPLPAARRSHRRPAADVSDLLDLVRLRVAQIHRCDVGESHYGAKLRLAGAAETRLTDLETWPVSDAYSGKERVALALAELLAGPSPGESLLLPRLLHQAQEELSRPELIELVLAVEAMQEWEYHQEDLHA